MARLRKFGRALAQWNKRVAPASASIAVEPLETRYTLSGNIDVATRGGSVFFRGDDLANAVEVSVAAGNIIVTGSDGTTINGSAAPFTLRSGTTQIDGSVFVYLWDGNDKFVMKGGLQINRDLHIFSGQGNDDLGFENASVLGTAIMLTDSGNDRLVLRSLSIGENFILDLGDGDDTLNTQSISVGDNVFAWTGDGADAIVVEQTTIADRFKMRTGSGNDTVSVVNSTIRDDLTLKTGVSDDFVSIQSTSIGEHLKIVSSDDSDAVVIGGNTSIGSFLMDFAGEGDDALQVASGVTIGKSHRIQVLVESNTVSDALVTQRLDDPQTGANTRAAQARAALGFVPATPLPLSISTASNATVASHETLLTTDSSFTISGNTLAGATIAIARDGDQIFNDGTTTADQNGDFSIDVALVHNDSNLGENPIVVRATDSASRTATQSADVHFVVGTVVRMETSLGFIDMELLDDDAPTFVDNFKSYFADYANSIVHRLTRLASDGLSVIQGGGFIVSGSSITPITTDPDIDNDFDPANLNIRGALSMARLSGNKNSTTSQWFINTVDNATLDAQEFTVFGHVIDSSLPIVDAIAALTEFDLRDLTGVSGLSEVPLRNYASFDVALTGTVATTNGSKTVIGTATSFTTAIPADKLIRVGGQVLEIDTVDSDTELTLTIPAIVTGSGLAAQVNGVPDSTQYVITTSVTELAGLA